MNFCELAINYNKEKQPQKWCKQNKGYALFKHISWILAVVMVWLKTDVQMKGVKDTELILSIQIEIYNLWTAYIDWSGKMPCNKNVCDPTCTVWNNATVKDFSNSKVGF